MSCLRLIRKTPVDILKIINTYYEEIKVHRKHKKVMTQLKREYTMIKAFYSLIQYEDYSYDLIIEPNNYHYDDDHYGFNWIFDNNNNLVGMGRYGLSIEKYWVKTIDNY